MFATVVLTIVILLLLVVRCKVRKDPPGPFPWPIIGSHFLVKNLSRKLGGQQFAFIELCKRYNSHLISLTVGTRKVIVVSGSKYYIDSMLRNEEFDGRPWNAFSEMRNLGKKQGITMNDGEEWKEIRGWTVRNMKYFGFGKQEMMDMIRNELCKILEKMKKGGVQKIKPVIGSAVLNVLWMLVAGKPFGNDQKLQYFSDLMDRRSRAFDMIGGVFSAFPWIRYVAPEMCGYNVLLALNKELKNFLVNTIAEHKSSHTPESKRDLIDMFLHEMKDENVDKSLFNEDQLIMILIDLFLAGCSTTAISLDFLFLSMVLHQDIQRKVQQEIDSMIPSDRLPDIKDRIKLPYVEAVIAESERMWPTLPVIGPRKCTHESSIAGYKIPKNTSILFNIYSVSVDPDIYPEPHKFSPERFMKDGVFEPNTNSLIFGKGRRRCPGETLAKSAMFFLFTGVMQKYTLLPVPGKGPTSVEIVPGIMNSPKPYEILVVER